VYEKQEEDIEQKFFKNDKEIKARNGGEGYQSNSRK